MAQRLTAITGVGSLTAAATLATVTDARDFKNGRQFAAWQGVVPRQDSSGGHTRLGHITKRGDTYLRGLLTQGRAFGSAGGADQGTAAAHPPASLDRATARARGLSQDLGGDRQQTRADDLGHPRQGRGLRSRRLATLEPNRTRDERRDPITERRRNRTTDASRDDRGEIATRLDRALPEPD